MSEILVELHRVFAGYNGHNVLKDINLHIYEQDFLGVIGPNGGGKTTLLKVILRLLRPVSGNIRYAGKNLENNIGYMPQINWIDQKFPIRVCEVIDSGLISEKKLTKKQKQEKVDEMLITMGLEELRNKPVGELSGGQLQRVLLSRAIISEPQLLILDEPNSYVDKRFEAHFYERLREINKQTAIVLVSHDIGTIISNVKNIACVNESLHYHSGPDVGNDWLEKHFDCFTHVTQVHKYPYGGCFKSPFESTCHCGLDPQSPENQCALYRGSRVKRGMTCF
ncbi:MAG: ABC transporter ATP-binding protein [Dysgonamonadaceae bacterium]|jgi:zinc transport system ATP-binding protein|nr:ABC transporter ATP-binding protein [Dysgonamonadaceae bacterium]